MTTPHNERALGLYAGAAGLPRDEQQSTEWLAGHDEATGNIEKGRDPTGKPPNIPSLCARDVRLVYNCNMSTRAACTHDRYPPDAKRDAVDVAIKRSRTAGERLFRKIKNKLRDFGGHNDN